MGHIPAIRHVVAGPQLHLLPARPRLEVRKIADRHGIMRAMAIPPTESRALIEKKLGEL